MHASVSVPLPRFAIGAFVPYTGFVVVLAMLFGGGAAQGLWSDAVVELASLPLLAWALFRLAPTQLVRSARWGIVVLCTVLALPLVQLIPLPFALWSALPGRAEVISAYEIAGVTLPSMVPISLDPAATWRSFLSLLPATAIFLAMLSLEVTARRILIALVLVGVFVSVPLDLLQMMGGDNSPLRFYAVTNVDRAVGFFANSNHNAAFLYCAIPFSAAWGIGLRYKPHRALLLALELVAVIIGLAFAQSRAGLILSVIAGLSCIGMVMCNGSGTSRRRLLTAAVSANVIALLIAFQFGYISMAKRMQDAELSGYIRWTSASVTLKAIEAYFPFGSGFGTFVPVYQTVEPRALLSEHYLNHAHDDWLELSLEGGVLSIFALLLFFAWYGRLSLQVWRPNQNSVEPLDAALARAGTIVVGLLMLHSIIDYPLRTIAMMVIFTLGCGLMILPKWRSDFRENNREMAEGRAKTS